MFATFSLLTFALVLAQPGESAQRLLAPRLAQGQELVYSGSFREEIVGRGNLCLRSYQLQTNIFVLRQAPRGLEVALLTVQELSALRPEKGLQTPRSVRLELARVDNQGHLLGWDRRTALLAPLEGPPSIEHGAFVAFPPGRVGPRQAWDAAEPGRPDRLWHIAGTESVNNAYCLKLVGEQQSEDWEQRRADRAAWRRTDTVWIVPSLGVASRVERVIEWKEPARSQISQRSRLRYDLAGRMTYPGRPFEDRYRVILEARRFSDQAAPFLHQPGLHEAQIAALIKQIARYLDTQAAVEPYTRAVVAVKQRLEAAQRGQASPEPLPEESPSRVSPRAALGQPAPDFVATDYIHPGSVRLQKLRGQPVLLVFYSPVSPLAKEVLFFAAAQQSRGATVLGLAVGDAGEEVRKQHAEWKLPYPVVAGTAFKRSYGVDATPRFLVLDAHGIVRGSYTGWGSETAREVAEELKHWLKR